MEVLKFPHSSLSKVCQKVPEQHFGVHVTSLLEDMYGLMRSLGGMGMAANQVGLDYRMFVMETKNKEKLFLINPTIINRSVTLTNLKEGCLSAPNTFIDTGARSLWVQVAYQDENGKPYIRTFTDIHSVCAQHEIDHLDGKSFLELPSIPRSVRRKLASKWGLKVK